MAKPVGVGQNAKVRSRQALSFFLLIASVATPLSLLAQSTAGSIAASPPSLTSCPTLTNGVLNSAPRVASGAKTVALTFDDGPGRSTDAIIKILRQFHVRATFFNVGSSMTNRSAQVQEEQQDGFLLGDHSASHPFLPGLSTAQQQFQITNVINKQYRMTATVPCVFRPPYGSYNSTTQSIARAKNMSFWMWNDGGGDWKAQGSGSQHWIRYIENAVINASYGQSHLVILLHNQPIAMPATVAALPTIIRSFLSRHYAFVDLLGRTGPPNLCGVPSAPTPQPAFSVLAEGKNIASGSFLSSPNGEFRLTMKTNGNLTLGFSNGRTLWSTGTEGHSGATATVNSDGSFSVVDSLNNKLWTSPNPHSGAQLQFSNGGYLTFVNAGTTFWRSPSSPSTLKGQDALHPGWFISSPDGRCRLFMTASGRLQLIAADNQTLWNNGVIAATNSVTVLQSDGNFLTRRVNGSHAWITNTYGHKSATLRVTNTGILVMANPDGSRFWVTQ
jgi:peptidoglycan/xylan/chitin deacetylase (PgdA/CDA1 family)